MSNTQDRTFASWKAMWWRVRVANDPLHPSHGRYRRLYRGVTVHPTWEKYETFLVDMGARPPGQSLDRIDGHLGYAPDNCRWATPNQQSRNRRVLSGSVSGVTGVTKRKGPRRGWEARITANRVTRKLGTFATIEQAAAARAAAEEKYWGADR